MAGSRWVRLDTGYLRNPKIMEVSPPAVLLHLASILWAGDQLTDGRIAPGSLGYLATEARVTPARSKRIVGELEGARLWTPNGRGWELHDYSAMNPQAMREVVEREREQTRERQRRLRERRR